MAKVKLNKDACKGCGLCVNFCPKKILAISNKDINKMGYHPVEVVDINQCIGCCICATMCPDCAISVED